MTDDIVEKSVEGKCCFCGEYKQLCKAHIIPKAIVRHKRNVKHLIGVNFDNNLLKTFKTPQSGYWDSDILCGDCDGKLGIYDEYIKKFFKKDFSKYKVVIDYVSKKLVLYIVPNTEYNYSKLKKSLISILWRASISQLKPCQNIQLGNKYTDACRNYLQNKTADIPEVEVISIAKMTNHPNDAADEITIYPYKRRIYNITTFNIMMLGYSIDLKVSQQIIDAFSDLQLTEKRLVISERDLRTRMPPRV